MSKQIIKTYRFVNDYSVITFTVPGKKDWTEALWDDAAQSDLEDYVVHPEQYWMDECFDTDEFLSV